MTTPPLQPSVSLIQGLDVQVSKVLDDETNHALSSLYTPSPLDIRMLLGYSLTTASPGEIEKIKDEMNRGMYIRRIRCLKWLLLKAKVVMDSLGLR